MRRKHIYDGMDVHKETTVIALAHGGRNGRTESFGTYATSIDSLKIALSRLRKKNAILHFAYESGPTGFVLQRRLKTDRRDAMLIAKMHRSGELDPIHVPDSGTNHPKDMGPQEKGRRMRTPNENLPFGYALPCAQISNTLLKRHTNADHRDPSWQRFDESPADALQARNPRHEKSASGKETPKKQNAYRVTQSADVHRALCCSLRCRRKLLGTTMGQCEPTVRRSLYCSTIILF